MSFEAPAPSAPEPFAGEPAQFSGCGKPAVVGCLVLLLVTAAGLFLLMWKAQDLLGFALGEYRQAVMESVPETVSVDERQNLERAFDSAVQAIESGRLEPEDLQNLQRALASPPRPGELLSREEILELTRALEAIGAGRNRGQEGRLPAAPEQMTTLLVAA